MGSLWGPISTNIPNVSLWARPMSSDGTRILGLIIRGQNGLAVATQVQRVSYACVGPGLGGKTLLHRVGISRASVLVLGCHFAE